MARLIARLKKNGQLTIIIVLRYIVFAGTPDELTGNSTDSDVYKDLPPEKRKQGTLLVF